ncbi:pyridoxamine 5'-phosphate oxidase-related FMN-binding protein, partial [Hyaloraphidium curvatum]
ACRRAWRPAFRPTPSASPPRGCGATRRAAPRGCATRSRPSRQSATDLLERMARTEFSPDDRAFVESVPMFFLATVDSRGMPTVSFKGGAPGFVRATGKSELCFPLYDGNGMQLTLGNIAATKKVGLLFVDFEKPRRLRAQGIARHSQDPALLSMFPGAQYVCVVEVKHLYVNCGRYIAKGHLEVSPHVPNAEGKQPLAGWKRLDVIGPVLSERDKKKVEQAGGYIGIDKYTGEDEPDMATLAVQ